jgi:hypothetical protein
MLKGSWDAYKNIGRSLMKSLWMTGMSVLGAIVLSLGGCAEHEDEEFQLIPGEFPKLVDVPNRPQTPQLKNAGGDKYFGNIEKKLIKEREEGLVDQKKNYEQMKELKVDG